jgi:hypothetical protein
LRQLATALDWQRYLSSPARATAAYGRAVAGWWIDGFTDLILRAVRGENMFVHSAGSRDGAAARGPFLDKILANESAFDANLEEWRAQRRKRSVDFSASPRTFIRMATSLETVIAKKGGP